MLKSIIFASFLFASSAFADYKKCESFYNDTCTPETCIDWLSSNWGQNCPAAGMTKFSGYTETSCNCDPNCDAPSVVDKFGNCTNPNDCLNGVLESDGSCNNNPPPADPMNAHNNDPAGCNAAGGYYFADGSCNGGAEALSKMFNNPQAVEGAFIALGGMALTATGAAFIPYTFGGSSAAMAVGAHATAVGLGMMMSSPTQMNSTTSVPASDVTSGEIRIKVSLTSSGGSSGSSSGTNVTKTNTTTGKVDQTLFVPPATKTAMADSSNVNKTDATLTNPIPMDGVSATTYDYTANTATTTTHSTGSTSSNPITTTKTTPITVSQNPDGTVTTTPTDTTVAPTVSGSGGGSITSPATGTGGTSSGTGTGGTGAGTGGSTGNGPDYTGVLNDIKKNTGDSSSFLDKILGMFNNTDSVDTSKASGSNADGHEGFDGLKGDLQGSFDGFVFTDPLGLNGMGGAGIASYGFTMLGHHYVILDQAMIDLLPLSLLRGLFLFLAALAGLITVVSGV